MVSNPIDPQSVSDSIVGGFVCSWGCNLTGDLHGAVSEAVLVPRNQQVVSRNQASESQEADAIVLM